MYFQNESFLLPGWEYFSIWKTSFFKKKEAGSTCITLRKYFTTRISNWDIAPWHSNPEAWELENCEILFERLFLVNEAVPRFTSSYGITLKNVSYKIRCEYDNFYA